MKFCPLERDPKSLAYIPYNKGYKYVCGGVNGGETTAYLEMIDVLKKRIDEDLSNGIIAIFHDESHINKYILDRKDVQYLTPEFCNPDDMNINYEKKIRLLDKNKYIDIKKERNISEESFLKKWKRRFLKYSKCELGYIKDSIFKNKGE